MDIGQNEHSDGNRDHSGNLIFYRNALGFTQAPYNPCGSQQCSYPSSKGHGKHQDQTTPKKLASILASKNSTNQAND
ncbi:hypothetical protein JCM14713_09610 [Desulfomicrobium salsuginis]